MLELSTLYAICTPLDNHPCPPYNDISHTHNQLATHMPDLSIVIVNYNTRDKLRDCIISILHKQGDLDLEIIVVDNGSKDGSAAMLREYTPEITLIQPEVGNAWFSGGNNIGVEASTSDYVLILNPDTIIQTNSLQTMLRYMQDNPEVGALTCKMQYPDGAYQQTCSMRPEYIDLVLGYSFVGALLAPYRNKRRQQMWYADWERNTVKSVEVIPGSNMFCRRELLMQLGTFDTDMRLYFVEDDLCQRIRDTGADIRFIPDTLILHWEHASVEQVQRLASRIYFQDLLTYCRKYHGLFAMVILWILMLPTRIVMAIAQRLRGEKSQL